MLGQTVQRHKVTPELSGSSLAGQTEGRLKSGTQMEHTVLVLSINAQFDTSLICRQVRFLQALYRSYGSNPRIWLEGLVPSQMDRREHVESRTPGRLTSLRGLVYGRL